MWEGFIGQTNLIAELTNLKDYPVSLLLRGNSGYGKTTLAKLYAIERGFYDYQLGSDLIEGFRYNPQSLTHIVDEVHELNTPEILYPFIDSGMTFVLCSNETNNLKEPLRNRVVERFFEDYSDEDLLNILKLKNRDLTLEIMNILVNRSRRVPRTLLQLSFLIRVNCDINNKDQIVKYLDSTGVYKDGFTRLDLKYIDLLKRIRHASLNTIRSNLNVPENQIREEIEPYLIRKGLISIGSGGRTYLGE